VEVRGRNRKWPRTGNQGAVREVGLVVVSKFCSGVGECGGKGNTFVVINIVELSAQHEHVRSEYGSGSRRGSVNRKERTDGGELVADFFLFNIEEVGNVVNHLFMGQGHLIAGRTVRRGQSNNVRGAASAVDRQ